MSESITAKLPLQRWQGDRGTYHLVTFTGAEAEVLAGRALIQKLETGRTRGFGSLKVTAQIGETAWKTSVFPQQRKAEWILLISKKVMKLEGLEPGTNAVIMLKI